MNPLSHPTHIVRRVERSFFHQVQDVLEGFVLDVAGTLHTTAHPRGIKVWYDDATREHYEAQLVRVDGSTVLEVGFHAEYPKAGENQAVLDRLLGDERAWRSELGDEPVAGMFIGVDRWRRISDVWESPDPDDVDAAIEVAARLAWLQLRGRVVHLAGRRAFDIEGLGPKQVEQLAAAGLLKTVEDVFALAERRDQRHVVARRDERRLEGLDADGCEPVVVGQ